MSVPVAIAEHDGESATWSMLGPKANWVRNVKAPHGHAILRRRGREAVTLEEIPAEQRAPVLRRYLAVAPGARPHTWTRVRRYRRSRGSRAIIRSSGFARE